MARGLGLCSQTKTTSAFLSTSIARVSLSPPICEIPFTYSRDHHLRAPRFHPSSRFFCACSRVQDPIDLAKYKEAFSRRMAMAGLKPRHRIALGVSGGPDSTALCLLAAGWKTEGLKAVGESGGCIDGLLAIIVDHGLRAESKEEAHMVQSRVSDMRIRCEIGRCNWLDGRPKQGHLQEAARAMRYQIFQNVCFQHQISVLLIAHHADDQAELFILRLSRSSGILGLAGMAFTSQIFPSSRHFLIEDSKSDGIMLVRPLLDFSKGDLYKICQGSNQDWVEDPTNLSPLFARSRIRIALGNLKSCSFKFELQAVISACRKTRTYVDQMSHYLINQTVTIMDQGYVVIDLERLNPSEVGDICLSKFLALVLQFISQRQRPVRGSTLKLLLDYIRTFPCKTSFTAAGCYLCPAPGSRGTKALVCCSVDCPLPLKMELFDRHSNGEQSHCMSNELEQIIAGGKSYLADFVPDASDVLFLHLTSESLLAEAKTLNILSESTYRNILLLQREEIKHFQPKTEDTTECESKHEIEPVDTSSCDVLRSGQICYFMNRFFITWKLSKEFNYKAFPDEACYYWKLGGEGMCCQCISCVVGQDTVLKVRHMVESDWLYLAKLSKCPGLEKFQPQNVTLGNKSEREIEKTELCSDYVKLSAQRALLLLKSIPVAARRSLPVLVNPHGLLLSVPSINFKHCPCLMVSAAFKPRVPLGGGHSSFA